MNKYRNVYIQNFVVICMKKVLLVLFALAFIPAVLAININVQKLSNNGIMIKGVNQPTPYTVQVTNNGAPTDLTFYSFFAGGLTPSNSISFKSGETKNITFNIHPRWDLQLNGPVLFHYYIQAKDHSEDQEKALVNIIPLGKAFSVSTSKINPASKKITISIINKVNFNFSDLSVTFNSPFFSAKEFFSLPPNSEKNFTINLNKKNFNQLTAGYYDLNSRFYYDNVTGNVSSNINFIKQKLLNTDEKNYGLLVATKVITKINNGNTIQDSQTIIKKNMFSRLFTTFDPEPDTVSRQGSNIYYTWESQISPGSSKRITIKTNWLIPFLIIIFLILAFYFARRYSQQKLLLRKKISFVRSKGGEFALRITLIAEAKEFIEKVRIVDRLPPLAHIYERFGGELPDKISKDKKRLEWDFELLDAGERRVMSYVIYSKVGILGKFALPSATGYFQQNGKNKETSSNKAFFLAEQKNKPSIK